MDTFMRNDDGSAKTKSDVRNHYTDDRSSTVQSAMSTSGIDIDIDNRSRTTYQSARKSHEAGSAIKPAFSKVANLSTKAVLFMKAKVTSKFQHGSNFSSSSNSVSTSALVSYGGPPASSMSSKSQSLKATKTIEEVEIAPVFRPTASNQSDSASGASLLTIIPEVDGIEDVSVKEMYEKELRAQAEYQVKLQAQLESMRKNIKQCKG